MSAIAAHRHAWILVPLILLLAGCATATLSLSPIERQALRIEAIKVEYAKDAGIWWGDAEREYLAKVDADPALYHGAAARKPKHDTEPVDSATRAQDIMSSPEAKEYLRTKLAGMVQKRLEESVKPKFSGSRPAILVVEIHSFTIPSIAQRVVLGGGPIFAALTFLKDARTGAELGKLDRLAGAPAGSGVVGVLAEKAIGAGDLESRVLDTYVGNVLRWLEGETTTPSAPVAGVAAAGSARQPAAAAQ